MKNSLNAVPYLRKSELEGVALALLYEYAQKADKVIRPPIPVEKILEDYLGYKLDITEKGIFGVRELLGGLILNEQKVCINALLLNQEGRFNFTVAHEIGHDQLHKEWLLGRKKQMNFFEKTSMPDVLCRENAGTKDRGEWQADYFAANLLMPRDYVLDGYKVLFGSKPTDFSRTSKRITFTFDEEWQARDMVNTMKEACGFANVSTMALRNRLIDLGLFQGLKCQRIETDLSVTVEEEVSTL